MLAILIYHEQTKKGGKKMKKILVMAFLISAASYSAIVDIVTGKQIGRAHV